MELPTRRKMKRPNFCHILAFDCSRSKQEFEMSNLPAFNKAGLITRILVGEAQQRIRRLIKASFVTMQGPGIEAIEMLNMTNVSLYLYGGCEKG